MTTIGDRLRLTITARAPSVRGFAEKSKLPYRSLQAYVTDEQRPSVDALLTLRAELGVNLDWLLTGQGPQFIANGDVKRRRPTLEDMREIDRIYDIDALAENLDWLRSLKEPLGNSLGRVLAAADRLAASFRFKDAFALPGIARFADPMAEVAHNLAAASDELQAMAAFIDEAVKDGRILSHPDVDGGRALTVEDIEKLDVDEVRRIIERVKAEISAKADQPRSTKRR